jgi:hypothetical protein
MSTALATLAAEAATSLPISKIPPWEEILVLPHRDGSWSPSEGDGVRAAVVEIFDPDPPHEVIDSVAWPLADPARWWLCRGICTHLGALDLRQCWWENRPIRLLPTPRDWVLDRGPGPSVCVLQWDADLRAIFWQVPEIRCASAPLANHLRRRLAEQVPPRFRISVE